MVKLVYVVDDERLITRTVSMFLRDAGYDVAVGYSVDQALDYLRENVPDCIVSDGNMNGRHGLEILELVRRDERLRSVGFVMLSAADQNGLSDRVRKLGGEFLFKPCDIGALSDLVEKQISLHQQR